jgi:protein SCO1/2
MFHPRLIGLTGDAAAIRAAADSYKVYYAKVPSERRDEYTVDHTAFIYLMGIDGKYLGFFPPGTAPERIADILRQQTALNP